MDEEGLLELKVVKSSEDGPDADKVTRQSSCCDGVFANMAAKPEQMVLPLPQSDLPPEYNTFPTWPPRNHMTTLRNTSSSSIDYYEAEFAGLLVEGYLVFFIHALIVIFFEWVGLFLSIYIANSHAGRCGGFFGLGCLLILASESSIASDQPPIGGDPNFGKWIRLVGFLLIVGSITWFMFVRYKVRRHRIDCVNF